MKKEELTAFFEDYMKKDSLFKDKTVLQSFYIPENIIHRSEQIKQIANILSPSLKLEKPSNLFIYGKTGTGKTLIVKHITQELTKLSEKKEIPLKIAYVNCKLKKIAGTEYRLIAQLIREFGKEIPSTGLPTEEVYNIFFNIIDKEEKLIILVLDEIDQLLKKTGDEILYNLIRINEDLKYAHISLVGISNDLFFIDNLDPRVKSSLSEEELIFPPYNALQIQDILRSRAVKAFKPEILQTGVIEKCAAYAAREHGDIRRALELLRVAGESAERKEDPIINMPHIDEAEDRIEKDRVFDIVSAQPKQSQAILYSILNLSNSRKNGLFTGEVYELYKEICSQTTLRPLTQRRTSDIIAELDMFGIINVSVISRGRYGRTREINLAVPQTTTKKIKEILAEGLELT